MVCAEARKSRLRGGGQPFRVPPIRCRKTRHQPHQPHIGPEMPVDMVAEVPLAGLSFFIPTTTLPLLKDATTRRQSELLTAMSAKNGEWFDIEMDKLDRWAEDRRTSFKADLEELDQSIKDAKKSARLAPNLPEKLEIQRTLRGLETKRDEAWRAYDSASRDVDKQKDALLDEISRRLEQQTTCETLFTLRWRVK